MPTKLKYEYIQNEFKKRGLILLSEEYKNSRDKLLFENLDGYKATMSYSNLSSNKSPQYFSKYNPYTIENIDRFLLNNNSNTKLLTRKFINSNVDLEFLCECGNHFHRSWINLNQQTYRCCNKCAVKNRGLSQRVDFRDVIDTFTQHGFVLISTRDEYNNNSSYLECIDKDGYRGYQSYNHLKFGRTTISKFTLKSNSASNVLYNLNVWAKNNNIKARCIDLCDFNQWTKQGIKCRCECGEIFYTSIASFMNGKNKCDKCSKSISNIEKMTMDWLNKYGIVYAHQYRIDDCRNILALPFDFYVPFRNLLIEVDGEGHYMVSHFNHCSYEKAEKTFNNTKKNDAIKNQYCKENNIPLLRIPYWEYKTDNYKNILYANLIKD